MAPKSESRPTTLDEWKRSLTSNGSGRARVSHLTAALKLDAGGYEEIKTAAVSRLLTIPGIAALLAGRRNDGQNKNTGKKRPFAGEAAHRRGAAVNQQEIARKIIHDAKEVVKKQHIQEDAETVQQKPVKLSPRKQSTTPSLALSLDSLTVPTPQIPTAALKPRRNTLLFDAATKKLLKPNVIEPLVHEGHPLLVEKIPNLLRFNVRLVNSETLDTITRMPFRYLLEEPDTDVTAGGFTGDDISIRKLAAFVQDVAPLQMTTKWKELGCGMTITHNAASTINTDGDLAVYVNDYINGPRSHTDLCITLILGVNSYKPPDIKAQSLWFRAPDMFGVDVTPAPEQMDVDSFNAIAAESPTPRSRRTTINTDPVPVGGAAVTTSTGTKRGLLGTVPARSPKKTKTDVRYGSRASGALQTLVDGSKGRVRTTRKAATQAMASLKGLGFLTGDDGSSDEYMVPEEIPLDDEELVHNDNDVDMADEAEGLTS
ncbi:hypothetical protein E8E12_000119 [Didymella heteroderae]|uniref:Uncharacterized protein n=1 Tax=Didymella heteroderae TaxID=1769908 RepID=A0A9P4WFB8_9PLEO|nr:hypothetical protein E8E12_000119 [Didymella heteroderae]